MKKTIISTLTAYRQYRAAKTRSKAYRIFRPNDDSQYRYFKYHLMVKYLLETERLTVDEVFQRAFDEKELAARVFKSL